MNKYIINLDIRILSIWSLFKSHIFLPIKDRRLFQKKICNIFVKDNQLKFQRRGIERKWLEFQGVRLKFEGKNVDFQGESMLNFCKIQENHGKIDWKSRESTQKKNRYPQQGTIVFWKMPILVKVFFTLPYRAKSIRSKCSHLFR